MTTGETENRCKRQVWEAAGHHHASPSAFLTAFYTAVPWEAKSAETNLLKFTQDIYSHTHTNPCSFHQGQQNPQPQVHLLLSLHASEG